MSYEVVFNVFLGILALLGLTLIIIFWLVFRNDSRLFKTRRGLGILRSHLAGRAGKNRNLG
jgi:hypothetical protein